MSEMEIASNTFDEGMEGRMDVHRLHISSYSLTTFSLEVEGKLHPGFEIGWVSSVTVCLKYGDILVGKHTASDTPMIADDENNVKTVWEVDMEPEIEIKSMRAFASFLQGVMPNKNTSGQLDSQKRTTAHLSVSPNGHALTMSIDLRHMERLRTVVESIEMFDDNNMCITVKITNLSPLRLLFEEGDFLLKQGQQTIGNFRGSLEIEPGIHNIDFYGEMQSGISGMATLKGDFYEDCDSTWQRYAIKLFEVEVNLDAVDADGY